MMGMGDGFRARQQISFWIDIACLLNTGRKHFERQGPSQLQYDLATHLEKHWDPHLSTGTVLKHAR